MFRFLFALVVVFGVSSAAHAQSSHLWNEGAGSGQCLDIVNDGTKDKLRVTGCGDFSGQAWTLLPTDEPGYYRLQTAFTGAASCLDVINDGVNDRVRMSSCANVTGQHWELARLRGPGRAFQLTTALPVRRAAWTRPGTDCACAPANARRASNGAANGHSPAELPGPFVAKDEGEVKQGGAGHAARERSDQAVGGT
jgi:hypothetical protein